MVDRHGDAYARFLGGVKGQLDARGLHAFSLNRHTRPLLRRAQDAQSCMKAAMSRDTLRANERDVVIQGVVVGVIRKY